MIGALILQRWETAGPLGRLLLLNLHPLRGALCPPGVYGLLKGAARLSKRRGPEMLLTVKALQGRECSLQVSPDERISSLKRLVSEKLNVPVSQQRLLFKGKALADEHCLSDYSIGPESKLNLVIKPQEKASPEEPGRRAGPPQHPAIWQSLAQVLGKHFSGADAEKLLEQVQKDYERSLRLLSLDDIERLATRLLHPEVAEAVEMGFLD